MSFATPRLGPLQSPQMKKAISASFDIFATKRARLFCRVYVWRSVQDMRDHARKLGLDKKTARRTMAFCASDLSGPQTDRNCYAEVHYCLKYIDPEVVSHEAFHATSAYARRRQCRDEETLATHHGKLCDALACTLSLAPQK